MTSPLIFADLFEWMAGAGALVMLLMVLGFAFWLWALIDAIRNPNLDDTMRLVWVLVIVFTNLLGAIIYAIIGRGGRRTAAG